MRNFTFILMLINGFLAIIAGLQQNYELVKFTGTFMLLNYVLFLSYCKIDEIKEANKNKKK